MAGHTLLQVLLVAVVFGSKGSQAQNGNFYFPINQPNDPNNPVIFNEPQPVRQPVHHPVRQPVRHPVRQPVHHPVSQPETVSRFVPQLLPPVRTTETPACVQSNNDPNQEEPCIADVDYNENIRTLINRLLLQQPSVNDLVSDPMLRVILDDPRPPPQTRFGGGDGGRFGGARESPVCVAQEELIFPQRAKTSKDDWVFVLNQDNVKQALRVEKCINEGRACNFGVASRQDVTTVCRQKYVYRRMLTLGNNNIEPEEVLMPSCCVCYFRRDSLDVEIRGGFNTTNGQPEPEVTSVAQPTVTSGQSAPLHSLSFAGNGNTGNTGNVGISNLSPNNQGAPQGSRPSSVHRRTTFITLPNTSRNQGNPFMPHGLRYN